MAHASSNDRLKMHMKRLSKIKAKQRAEKSKELAELSPEEIKAKQAYTDSYLFNSMMYDYKQGQLHHSKYSKFIKLLDAKINSGILSNMEIREYEHIKRNLR